MVNKLLLVAPQSLLSTVTFISCTWLAKCALKQATISTKVCKLSMTTSSSYGTTASPTAACSRPIPLHCWIEILWTQILQQILADTELKNALKPFYVLVKSMISSRSQNLLKFSISKFWRIEKHSPNTLVVPSKLYWLKRPLEESLCRKLEVRCPLV